jgi:PAS domain S-box-containing protein
MRDASSTAATAAREAGGAPGWIGRVCCGAAVCAAMAGLLVLIGWAAEVEILKRLRPGFTAMNPLTACAFVLSGTAVLLRLARRPRAAFGTGAAIVLLAVLKLADLTLVAIPIDQVLFPASLLGGPGSAPNSMAPNTAMGFLLVGLALAVSIRRSRRAALTSQVCAGAVLLISMFALIGYGFGMDRLNTVGLFIPMAVHTAVVLLILSVGLLALHGDVGIMLVLRDPGAAGSMARTVLPLAIMIPIAVGVVRLWGQQQGYYGTEVGVALQVIANVLVTSALLISSIVALHMSDTVRRGREQALARSENQYRLAETVANVGHWRLELPSRSVQWSEELFRICGIDRAAGTPSAADSLSIYHPDDRERAHHGARSAMKEGRDWVEAVRLCRPDGEVRHVISQGMCERDGEGNLTSVFGVIADVTELERARRQAEAATATKAAFLANMSHEIRTPLNGVMGFAELLLASDLEDEQRRHANLIFDSSQALLKLLNDILDVSKIDAGQLEVVAEPFDLDHQLRQCVRLMSSTAQKKGLELSVAVDPNLPKHILGDGLRVRQVVLNLLGNAVKFTDHGSVTLEASEAAGPAGARQIRIRVTDTGVGIPEARQASVFEEFVQADTSISRRFGGSGLGLSISRRLVALMGGDISLESEEGVGTRATMTLPLREANHPMRRSSDAPRRDPDPAAGTAPAPGGREVCILLVEDLDINRELITGMLGRMGYRVETAADGAEAIHLAEASQASGRCYDLIFMDVQMPVVDGLTATRAIRALGSAVSRVPIVALTANAYASEIKECREAGMDDHLSKPVSMAALGGALTRWLPREGSRQAGRRAGDPRIGEGKGPPLADKFAQRIRTYAARLEEIGAALAEAGPEARACLLAEAGTMAHNLSGTAAMFGRPEVGELAAAVEDRLAEGDRGADKQVEQLAAVLKAAA